MCPYPIAIHKNNDTTYKRRSLIHSGRTCPYARKLLDFFHWTRSWRKPRADWKIWPLLSGSTVAINEDPSSEEMIRWKSTVHTNSGLAERWLLWQPRILRPVRTPSLYEGHWKSRAKGERQVSLFYSDWEDVPEAPSNETARQFFDASCDAFYCTVEAGKWSPFPKAPIKWHMSSCCSFPCHESLRSGKKR